ncbi:16S ribosomal RNA methyltransferase RsmE [Nitritalea halalkaliphila LW7]|uniref:Ribosomal RNA small subunit methyltransferase E n=1 Tax=Nitritalea halalkaliphila LW7 TaxID=1189621 RepID=I5C8F6_9BACT|nr:RsmE family RNA methyltransferase [Nitritalea halalkaliphila]EIM78108.1 16S ribosomal RNA methyltransferase RsmE [Nitritalea halalkaliphila LW7]
MQLFYFDSITAGQRVQLSAEESKHLIKVLRKQIGDTVFATDGRGLKAQARIVVDHFKQAELEVLEVEQVKRPDFHITVALAPTKNQDRIEWFLEKATEVGVDQVLLMQTDHSEKSYLKEDRLEKKILAAAKQSHKFYLPTLETGISFDALLTDARFQDHARFIAYVSEQEREGLFGLAPKNAQYLLLIGPEGDFSTREITAAKAAGFLPCALGPYRLRTETAALMAVHTLQLKNT